MKSPFTLLASVQNKHSQRTGDSVVYTHANTPLPSQIVTVQSGDFLKRDDKEFVNHMSFLNVVLPSKPTPTDSIAYDGEVWDVDEWRPAGSFIKDEQKVTMYDLSCVVKRVNPTSRTQYQRRGGR